MIRSHARWKSSLALLAGLTVVGTTAANGSPITMTEASWNDDVHVSATLTASPHTGVNYSRAATVNGKVERQFTDSSIVGNVVYANTLTSPDIKNPIANSFDDAGFLNLVYFESNSRSCARVSSGSCYFETPQSQTTPAYAVSSLNALQVKTSKFIGAPILEYKGSASNPARTTATCIPGEMGIPGVVPGSRFDLRVGRIVIPQYKALNIPTVSGEYVEGNGYIESRILGWTYVTRITYNSISEVNYALSEVNLTIYAQPPLEPDPDEDTSTWSVDVNLSRAECGISKPLDDGVVTATAGNAKTMNTVMDEVLAGDLEEIEAGTLDDALTETNLTENDKLATTTTETPNSEDDTEADAEGATTSPSTSATSSTIPEIAQQTVTVTSTRPSTANSATTSATTSRLSASATRNTSVSATPPSTPPTSQSTPSTSAAPAIVIPDEPGTLASNARLDDVETITVGEEELDVVAVKGEDIPADAKQGARALEIWLGGGSPGTAWEAFASDDPDADGWRWAAINQKTGTVVYIR